MLNVVVMEEVTFSKRRVVDAVEAMLSEAGYDFDAGDWVVQAVFEDLEALEKFAGHAEELEFRVLEACAGVWYTFRFYCPEPDAALHFDVEASIHGLREADRKEFLDAGLVCVG